MDMHDDDKKQLILDCARRLLGERGVKRTTMGEIAKGAGVGKPCLYDYFASKDEIVCNVIEREIARLQNSIRQGVDEVSDQLERVTRVWSNAIEFYEQDDFLFHLVRGNDLGIAPYLYDRYLMEIESYVVDLLEKLISEAIDAGCFTECDSRIAAYIGYKIYQGCTYGRTETLREYPPRRIMDKTMRIMGLGILERS